MGEHDLGRRLRGDALRRGLLGQQVRPSRVQRGAQGRAVEEARTSMCATSTQPSSIRRVSIMRETTPVRNCRFRPARCRRKRWRRRWCAWRSDPATPRSSVRRPSSFKLGQLVAPNLGAAVMNGFMDVWSKRADAGADTSGTLFDPPETPSGPDGGRRRPDQRRKAVVAAGATAAVGLAGLGAWLWRRR